MKIKSPLRALSAALCVMFSSHGFAAASNPVSTAFVDRMILETIENSRLRAGNGISIIADIIADVNDIGVAPELAIGELYQGGVVFYLDDTKRHGLAVAISATGNASTYSSTSPVTSPAARLYTQANGVGAGAMNSVALNNSQSVSSLANGSAVAGASLALNASATTGQSGACDLPVASAPSGDVAGVVTDCVGGWYLPSVHEMFLLADSLVAVNVTISAQQAAGYGGTLLQAGSGSSANYWTSSTINSLTNPLGGTYTTPGQAAYYVNISSTVATSTAIPSPGSDWNSGLAGVGTYRWIRQF
jgi:hypothetical protein